MTKTGQIFLMLAAGAILPASAFAQKETPPTFKQRIPKQVFNTDDAYITLTAENDLFGGGTDQNYTNGTRLTYFKPGIKAPEFANFLSDHMPIFEINETTSVYYSIGQNLYTPENITARTPDSEDRPYAAFLYGSAGFSTVSDNHIDEAEITLGIVGPWALGEETQKVVHDLINDDDPSGWKHQLKNEPGLILSWQRQWPEAFYGEIDVFHARLSPHAGASIGNIYTYASAGLTLQLTPKQYKWQSQPLRVRPSIPGAGTFSVPDNRFAWSLFAGVEGRTMGRNIFLDGNTFEHSPSVDKSLFVADANAGISFTYGKTQLSYTLNWRSKEFDAQSDDSIFGAISIGYRF